MQGLKIRWNKFRSSLAFRLSLYYSISAFVMIFILLGVIYLQIMGAVHTSHYKRITADAKRIEAIYQTRGKEALLRYLETELNSLNTWSQELIYMKGADGEKIVGNVDHIPQDFLSGDYLAEVGVYKQGRYIDARLRQIRVGEDTVYIGRDLQELEEFRGLIARTSFITVIIAIFLTALSTYWFMYELRSGASSIRKTAMQIRAGRFKNRIPVGEQDDELALLIKELNLMLDHMESSLHGVRYVSDTIAHNLRTPIMRVHSILRPVEKDNLNAEQMRAAVVGALSELDLLSRLFDKLLYVSELESGVQRQGFTRVDMTQLVSSIVDLYSAYAEDCAIKLEQHVVPNACVVGDRDLIASAINNLVENALKYTLDEIELRLYKNNEAVCIEVIDNGKGVQEASLALLGQHFYRDGNSDAIAGTGLGLSSVLAIMRLHQGECTFTNNKEGGFKVCLRFPTDSVTEPAYALL